MQLTNSLNDQLMAMSAHRYCLGRRSYIVSSCIEWIHEIWEQLIPNTQYVMLRDTIEALYNNNAGDPCDALEWRKLALWMWDGLKEDKEAADWLCTVLQYRGISTITGWLNDYKPDRGK